jgi:hypothetical protein
MRMSRVLLAGVAVAAAGVATSAFTNSNSFTGVDNNVAGFGEASVSGATITNIAYTPAADASLLTSVVFQASNDFVGSTTAIMQLKLGIAEATGQANSCSVDAGTDKITCTLTTPMPFINFNNVALTVASQ